MTATPLPPRSEVPAEATWDAESIFASPAGWEAEHRSVEAGLGALARFRGRLGEGPATLADWLEESEALLRAHGRLRQYAYMGAAVDSGEQDALARDERARGLGGRLDAALAFAEPELLALDDETLRRWVREEPRLTVYAHWLERLERRRAHVRGAEVEETIALAAEATGAAAAIHRTLANADLRLEPAVASDGARHELAQATFWGLEASRDRELRRTAWERYTDAHLAVRNTMAACVVGGAQRNAFVARARRHGSALEAALAGYHVPVAVLDNVLEAFAGSLSTWRRYWAIRRRALGVDELCAFDLRVPLVDPPHVPFEQAVAWTLDAVHPLGDDYRAILAAGLTHERWVDARPNRGKQLGAFSSGAAGTRPFLIMSYAGEDLVDASTLAHEAGHSMHTYLSHASQPYVYARYDLILAEVPSNLHQVLLRDHLLRQDIDATTRIAVIEETMACFYRYLFVMLVLTEFERDLHARVERGEAPGAGELGEMAAGLLTEAYGDAVTLRPGDRERVGVMWAQFHTHLYLNFFVFQYATGIAAAYRIGERILAGEPGARDAYLDLLRAGSSRYPLDTLRAAGVDLTDREPVASAFTRMAALVDELDALV